jgi:hypothetical protein
MDAEQGDPGNDQSRAAESIRSRSTLVDKREKSIQIGETAEEVKPSVAQFVTDALRAQSKKVGIDVRRTGANVCSRANYWSLGETKT